MQKKLKVKYNIDPKATIESVIKDYKSIGISTGENTVVVGGGIGLAVLDCKLAWETREKDILFTVKGSDGASGAAIFSK